jgi:hypothetical protein
MGFQFGAPCPFHKEKTPSFFIHPEKQFYKCWGCNAEGDVFRFVQQMESLPGFRETAQRVAELAGVPLTDEPWTQEQKQEYVRRREHARAVAVEAEQFWRDIRRHLTQRYREARTVELKACRWALKHFEDDDPLVGFTWTVVDTADRIADFCESRLEILEAAEPDALVAIYLEHRSPALAARFAAERDLDERHTGVIVAILAVAAKRDERKTS